MKAVIKVKDTYVRNKISSLTFMLSIAIVIYHSDSKRAMHYISMDMLYYLTEFCSAVLNFAVPCFFLISSFLFTETLHSLNIKTKFIVDFIVYVYLMFFGIFFIVLIFISLSSIPFLYGKFNSVVMLSPLKNLYGVLNSDFTPLWFVKDLIIYVILSPVIYVLIKRKIFGILSFIMFMVLNVLFEFDYKSIFYWAPIYLFGAFIGVHFSNKIFHVKLCGSIYVSLAFGFLIGLFALLVLIFKDNRYLIYFYCPLSPVIIWLLFDAINKKSHIPKRNIYNLSFFIYANHFFWLTGIQKVVGFTFHSQIAVLFINYFIVPIIVLVFLYTVAFILKRRASRIYYLINGGRV